MATWFWVAAAPANFATANWATSSGGVASGQPTTAVGDIAIFDGGSSQTCTIAASVSLARLDCMGGTGNFAGTLAHSGAVTLTISAAGATALRFSSGMTYTVGASTSSVTFTLTSGTANITSNGKNFASITMNGVGGTVQQLDNLSITGFLNGGFTLTAGVWDCNNSGPFTFAAPIVNISGATARTFICAGTITVGGNASIGGTVWGATTTTNLTFTKNSANLVITGGNSALQGYNVAFGSLTYNGVTFAAVSSNLQVVISGNLTCSSLSINPGWSIAWAGGATATIGAAFTWTGTPTQPIYFGMTNLGAGIQNPIISCPSGTCTIQWATLVNLTFTGGATYVATDTLTGGQTTGLTSSPPVDASALPALVASAIWQDLLSTSDFTTSGSIGAMLKQLSNLQFTVPAIGRGTCTTGGSSTSIPTSAWSIAPGAANQFNNTVVMFDANTTTAALRGVRSPVSAVTNSATPTFTVAALPATPASGDTFSVL